MRRRSASQNRCIVAILRVKGLSELSKIDPSISTFVESLEEQFNVVHGRMHTYVGQAILQVCGRDGANAINVKDSESIKRIEVRALDYLLFGSFKTSFQTYKLIDHLEDSLFSVMTP